VLCCVYAHSSSRLAKQQGTGFLWNAKMSIAIQGSWYCKHYKGRSVRYVDVLCNHCGETKSMRLFNAKRALSCGCIKAAHGHASGGGMSPTYQSWSNMYSRCYNSKARGFHNYGGRGITICDKWRTFELFLQDMGERPENTSLDRIDVNGNYEPGNCRWATRTEQNRNKSNNRILTIYGKSMCVTEWRAISGVSHSTVRGRLLRGWTEKEAIFGRHDETFTHKQKQRKAALYDSIRSYMLQSVNIADAAREIITFAKHVKESKVTE